MAYGNLLLWTIWEGEREKEGRTKEPIKQAQEEN